jgi:hypothetical protein
VRRMVPWTGKEEAEAGKQGHVSYTHDIARAAGPSGRRDVGKQSRICKPNLGQKIWGNAQTVAFICLRRRFGSLGHSHHAMGKIFICFFLRRFFFLFWFGILILSSWPLNGYWFWVLVGLLGSVYENIPSGVNRIDLEFPDTISTMCTIFSAV